MAKTNGYDKAIHGVRVNINPGIEVTDEFKTFLKLLPEFFAHDGTVIYSKRNTIKRFCVGTARNEIVVKSFRTPNAFNGVVYGMLRKSKAERALINSQRLTERGVSTPTGLAFVEVRKMGRLINAYYVSEADDSPPIKDRLITLKKFDETMAEDFATFVASLHRKGVLHHDLNSTNVLYRHTDNGRYAFSLIDINRMSFCKEGYEPKMKDCMKNLTRFTGRMDLFRFVATVYASCRQLDVQATVNEMIKIKIRHDRHWRRIKAFTAKFKKRKA